MAIGGRAGSCIVVGAGLSGLLAARALQEHGWQVTVLDKERRVGGRLATMRLGEAVFDHGAQFFTARGERFRRIVDGWLGAGVVAEWSRGFARPDGAYVPDGHPRYRGSTGMDAISRHLAQGLDVLLGRRVEGVTQDDDRWRVRTQGGASLSADALLLTAPVPQSLALIDTGEASLPAHLREALEKIEYGRCISVMALLGGPSAVPAPGGVQYGGANGLGEPVWWLADNNRKGISPRAGALTVHAGPAFSLEHWDAPDEEVTELLLREAGRFINTPVRTLETSRWRYSMPAEPYPESCLLASASPPLVFAGDAFGGPKVEGAAMSGLAAAEALVEVARG